MLSGLDWQLEIIAPAETATLTAIHEDLKSDVGIGSPI